MGSLRDVPVRLLLQLKVHTMKGVTIQWTGLLDWNAGLDYWTDIFLVFTHSEVGFIEYC